MEEAGSLYRQKSQQPSEARWTLQFNNIRYSVVHGEKYRDGNSTHTFISGPRWPFRNLVTPFSALIDRSYLLILLHFLIICVFWWIEECLFWSRESFIIYYSGFQKNRERGRKKGWKGCLRLNKTMTKPPAPGLFQLITRFSSVKRGPSCPR